MYIELNSPRGLFWTHTVYFTVHMVANCRYVAIQKQRDDSTNIARFVSVLFYCADHSLLFIVF